METQQCKLIENKKDFFYIYYRILSSTNIILITQLKMLPI